MIHKLRQIVPGVYRGSAPSPQDVEWLKNHLGIKKIVSLDQDAGEVIDRACKLLHIKHIKLYIGYDRKSLYHALSYNLKDLLLKDSPTFIHCQHGKDRTGLFTALFKCLYLNEKPERAIAEAKTLGFGIGMDPSAAHLFEKLIKSCHPVSSDNNSADIVSNQRDYHGDNRDSFLDQSRPGSFAPYLDHTRQLPMDSVYTYTDAQSPTRQDFPSYKEKQQQQLEENSEGINGQPFESIPQIGVFDNEAGSASFGPTINMTGFING